MADDNTSNRGLANADEQTREEVARKGGQASKGGFASMPKEKVRRIAKKGGEASGGRRNSE
jgi:general stress protein YciG